MAKKHSAPARVSSPLRDEHYYGLGQNQEGILDHRGRTIDCKHNYDAPAGETVCVPFLVTNKGYGIVWDNPSATEISAGLHGRTSWQSKVGERVSYFVITGATADELYAGYRKLTGVTPLPPKAAFGYIQSKARYENQKQVLDDRGGLSPARLSARRHGGRLVLLDAHGAARHQSCRLSRSGRDEQDAQRSGHAHHHQRVAALRAESRYFDLLAAKGWLLKARRWPKPVDGLPVRNDRAGALLDSTNPEAREWFWEQDPGQHRLTGLRLVLAR